MASPPEPEREAHRFQADYLNRYTYLSGKDTQSEHCANDIRKMEQRRWSHVMTLLLGAFCAISYLVVSASLVHRRTWNSRQQDVGFSLPIEDEDLAKDIRLEKYQTPSDTHFCLDWSESHSDSSIASFELPPSTNLTFFLSRGSPMSGNFIIHRERTRARDIIVEVIAQYEDFHVGREQLKKVKACFAGQDHEQGILLWGDLDDTTLLENIQFNISVHLPDITRFHDISTDFTNSKFTHHIGDFFDLWRPTSFGEVRLSARDAPVTVMTMITMSSFVRTTNANLTCGFWSVQRVGLQTSNAPAFSTIFALGPFTGAETSLSIKTSNAPITAFLAMASDFSHTKLNASVHTSSGSIDVIMPRAMMLDSSVFVLDASTTDAPASIYLAPEFEGPFDLQTTAGGRSSVEWDPNVRDPSNKGRKRVLEMYEGNSKPHKAGKMYWGEEPQEENFGDIKMRTTQADVVIHTYQISKED